MTAWRSIGAWIIVGVLGVWVLSFGAAFAPPIVKRLLLFYAGFGVVAGTCLGWLARELIGRTSRFTSLGGSLLIVLGGIHLATVSYGEYWESCQARAAERPDDVAALSMLERIAEQDPQLREPYLEERRTYDPRFVDYLWHRVSAIGPWPAPWPVLFWIVELLVAAGLGGWVIGRFHDAAPHGAVSESEDEKRL